MVLKLSVEQHAGHIVAAVSPLASLMKDQMDQLKQHRISAVYLSDIQHKKEHLIGFYRDNNSALIGYSGADSCKRGVLTAPSKLFLNVAMCGLTVAKRIRMRCCS